MSGASPFSSTRVSATEIVASVATSKIDAAFDSPEEARLKQEKSQLKVTYIVFVVAIAAIVIGILAMVIEDSIICYVAFAIPLFVSPYAIRQRRKINRMPTLRMVMNSLRQQVNRMSTLNIQLHTENNRLTNELGRLKGIEAELSKTAEKMGSNVDSLRQLVKENGETQRQMKQLQEAREMQNLLTAILVSDTDGDAHISENEFSTLMLRLKAFGNRPVNQEKLREAFRMSGTTQQSATTLFRAIFFEEEPEAKQNYERAIRSSFAYNCME